MSRLAANPWSTNGKKVLRNRTGKAVVRTSHPAFFLFRDDENESGMYDPYLAFWFRPANLNGFWGFNAQNRPAKILNLPGETWYASPSGLDQSISSFWKIRMWATLTENRPSRSMTCLILGMKIHVPAMYGTMTDKTPNFIGEMLHDYDTGHYFMNGVDCGVWPHWGYA